MVLAPLTQKSVTHFPAALVKQDRHVTRTSPKRNLDLQERNGRRSKHMGSPPPREGYSRGCVQRGAGGRGGGGPAIQPVVSLGS